MLKKLWHNSSIRIILIALIALLVWALSIGPLVKAQLSAVQENTVMDEQ